MPSCREPLQFYEAIATFQPNATAAGLLTLVAERGPEPLRAAATALDEPSCERLVDAYVRGEKRETLESFFARVLLQVRCGRGELVRPASSDELTPGTCPDCGHRPQLLCAVSEGDGTRYEWSCSICFGRWSASRAACDRCGERGGDALAFYEASDDDTRHLAIRACEKCRAYWIAVRLDVDPHAVPDVDEVAALPLDVWARERGYDKPLRNLVGM